LEHQAFEAQAKRLQEGSEHLRRWIVFRFGF
jgi:hypothetical protein